MRNKITLLAICLMMAVLVGGTVAISRKADAQTKVRVTNKEQTAPAVTAVTKQPDVSFNIPVKRINNLIAIQTGGKEIREVVRVFSGGSLIDNPGLVSEVMRRSATYDPDTKKLVVLGDLYGDEVVEDIRFLDLDEEHAVVLRDVYLDGQNADLSVGRGLPVEIGEEAQNPTNIASQNKNGEMTFTAAVAASPSISSISGFSSNAAGITNGKVNMDCGAKWNGHYVINDQPGTYLLTLNGVNFGASPGTVNLGGRNVNIKSWSNTKIVIDPTLPYDSAPSCALLKITTSGRAVLNSGLNIVPALRTRIYGQCTYHVAWTRLRMGKNPSPSAYGNYKSITGSYVPTVGDQYQFNNGKHTAIVVGVSNPVQSAGGLKMWTLTISEQNADCKNGLREYKTTFQSKTTSSGTTVTAYPKASYGSYTSTLYYR